MGDAQLIDDLMLIRRCLRCGEHFTEQASLACLECRRHPGIVVGVVPLYGHEPGTYSCCGASPDPTHHAYRGPDAADGCRQCDHSADPGVPEDIEVPYASAHALFGIGDDRRRRYTHTSETHVRLHRAER